MSIFSIISIIFYACFIILWTYWIYYKDVIKFFKKQREEIKIVDQTCPQSGFWITCRNHGQVSISIDHYNKQCEKFQFRCPYCNYIPMKIWKD